MSKAPTSSDTEIRSLLERIGQRDPRAMRELHAMLGRRIVAYAMHRLNDQDMAETVMTDTLMEIWQRPERFRFESQFSTWVLGIAKYKLLTMRRAASPHHEDIADYEGVLADPTLDAPSRIACAQEHALLRECLETLGAVQRESLHLAYFEEMSIEQIAEIQGVPNGTVKTRVFHGRKNMKICLERKSRRLQ